MLSLSLRGLLARSSRGSGRPALGRHSSGLISIDKPWVPANQFRSAKVEVNIYLADSFLRHHGIRRHLRKVRFLASLEELSSVGGVRAAVLRRRPLLRHAEHVVLYSIPGAQLRPLDLAFDPALDLGRLLREADAKVLQLFIEVPLRYIASLPFAPQYLRGDCDPPDPSLTPAYTMISFFAFNAVASPHLAGALLRELWAPFRALGRVYLAEEGINAQMAVPSNVFERFKLSLKSVSYLSNISINVDEEVGREQFEAYLPFHGLHIRVKDRLVADGGIELDLGGGMGAELSPAAWHAAVDDPAALVIDCRNKFESDVGHFRGARPLDTASFRESWGALEALLRGRDKAAPVLTYCTGGIRCVKTNAFLVQRLGLTNVSRLQGGIINYVKSLKAQDVPATGAGSDTAATVDNTTTTTTDINTADTDTDTDTAAPLSAAGAGSSSDSSISSISSSSKFLGVNYVFDERVCSRVTRDVLSACAGCGAPWDMYSNCSSPQCSARMLLCAPCFAAQQGCCCRDCQTTYETFLRNCSSKNNSTVITSGAAPAPCVPVSAVAAASASVSDSAPPGAGTGAAEAAVPRRGVATRMSFQMWRRTKANSFRVTSAPAPASPVARQHSSLSTAAAAAACAAGAGAGGAEASTAQYCERLTSAEPPYLRRLREETERLYPTAHGMSCGAHLGRLLSALSRMRRPQRVLELGCFTGYSALCLAEGLPAGGGRLVTVERDPRAAAVARESFRLSQYAGQITLLEGSVDRVLRGLSESGEAPFDLVFIDADKNSYRLYCELLLELRLLSRGAVLLLDNTLWKGAVLQHQGGGEGGGGGEGAAPSRAGAGAEAGGKAEKKLFEKSLNMHNFNEFLREHPSFQTVMLPIRDGLTIVHVQCQNEEPDRHSQ
jgi:predicted sulfurtransferase/predicted O-methyltransferase YrrM